MKRQNLVIVGNGMVGHRFLEVLIEKGVSQHYNLTVFAEEPCRAYDRVHLSSYFAHHDPNSLSLCDEHYYEQHQITLFSNDAIMRINRQQKQVVSQSGHVTEYDKLVIATGAHAWVPPIDGRDNEGCFVYRTLQDVAAIEAYATQCQSCAVIGGGLLGLEAAGAMKALGLDTHVVEYAPVLMAEQLDLYGGQLLTTKIEQQGMVVHTGSCVEQISTIGQQSRKRLHLSQQQILDVDMVIFSTGIRPNDQLARQAGLEIGQRGGVVIDQHGCTSDSAIYAIGECASWQDRFYGLVAPGYQMAQTVVAHLMGESQPFYGADMSAKLKLAGIDVASIGDAKGQTKGALSYRYWDDVQGIYKRLVVSEDNQLLLGAVLVGDTTDYSNLLQLMLNNMPLPAYPEQLILPHREGGASAMNVDALPDHAQLCSCYNVTKSQLTDAIAGGCHTMADLKRTTKAGTGCGGCTPLITQLLNSELAKQGIEVTHHLCAHFPYSRQELLHIIQVHKITRFDELIARYGNGYGCEICKPTVASLLASCWNDYVLRDDLAPLQETNDLYLANLQKDGTYSVIPRMAGGEVTPEGLIAVGQVAQQYHLYTKITGSQRVGLFGAKKSDLPAIWQALIVAGFETGHAYAKAVRMAKTCVGSSWCRFGVGDSTALGVALENRYKGIRFPHKVKIGVSGCTRECAEAQAKDIGVIATEKGWNLYVCGNGGIQPRHADLFATDLDEAMLIQYIDRVLMYYLHSADKLQRTATWLESLDGGLDALKAVIINDKLGICQALSDHLAQLRQRVSCEWQDTLKQPHLLPRFAHFVNTSQADPLVQYVPERAQFRPAKSEEREVELCDQESML